MNSVLERVYEIGIIPVIAFNSVDEAIPLCKALMDGGLPAAEVTFRTACAEECIKKIHEESTDRDRRYQKLTSKHFMKNWIGFQMEMFWLWREVSRM